ncbi:MAG TPA: class I SAM-dependent methyltransferase [Candidatus Polarisedimenticolia bacterium]|nr:class I SAM-dependent methyltransferase [Candidatus Polarisedimenticolia bacterium]
MLERTEAADDRIPTAWGQAYPRSIRLAPEGFFVPSATLRVLLQKSGRIEVFNSGFAFVPFIGNAERLTLDRTRPARPGDLVCVDVGGWGDLRRILARGADGDWVTGIDPAPRARERIAPDRLIAVVSGKIGAGDVIGRTIAMAFPIWSRLASMLYRFRKVLEAPRFGDAATDSVRRKYSAQVDSYSAIPGDLLRDDLRGLLEAVFPAGGRLLIAASGAGGEAIQLARGGYRVTGFDVLENMVSAARRNASAAGVEVEFVQTDMADLDLPGRTFDGIYVTPLVYSFVPGRARRLRSLRRLGMHLAPGAPLVFSAHLMSSPWHYLQTVLTWLRHGPWRGGHEFGDWFTWFLLPDGTIGTSFSHMFTLSAVVGEARAAGFRDCRLDGAYFVASAFDRGPGGAER